jgi:sigma-B regulation protein RsbU (phosphoserine phosphatase)
VEAIDAHPADSEPVMARASGFHAALIELQQAIHPPVPELFDPELGVRYVPADEASAGGDSYDWQVLADGSLHLAVIDVVGKGLSAVRDALTITHALRLLAISGAPVENLIESADHLLAGTYPEMAATIVVARYDPPTGALIIANGGHPPPLLIEPDGITSYLETPGRALGWPQAGSDEAIAVSLARGAAVVFYTDGLIEAHRDIEGGLDTLRKFGSELAGVPADELARTLVPRILADADRHDDTLAVTLRRPPTVSA